MAFTKKYVGTSDSLSVCWFGSFVIHACHLRFSRHFLPFYIFWIKILLLDAHRNMPTSKVTKNMCQFLFLQIWFRFDFNKWSRSKFLKSSENSELNFLEFGRQKKDQTKKLLKLNASISPGPEITPTKHIVAQLAE